MPHIKNYVARWRWNTSKELLLELQKKTIEEDEGDLEKKKADSTTTRHAATGTDDALATVNELVTLRLDLEDDYNDALVC